MRTLFAVFLTVIISQPLLAQDNKSNKAPAEMAESLASSEMTWSSIKAELISMTKSFKDRSLSRENKMKLFPKANATLSLMQDLKLTPEEKSEQIKIVVTLISHTYALDYASSNLDTIYFDYEKFKALYDAEINKIKSTKIRNDIKDTLLKMKASSKNLEK